MIIDLKLAVEKLVIILLYQHDYQTKVSIHHRHKTRGLIWKKVTSQTSGQPFTLTNMATSANTWPRFTSSPWHGALHISSSPLRMPQISFPPTPTRQDFRSPGRFDQSECSGLQQLSDPFKTTISKELWALQLRNWLGTSAGKINVASNVSLKGEDEKYLLQREEIRREREEHDWRLYELELWEVQWIERQHANILYEQQ